LPDAPAEPERERPADPAQPQHEPGLAAALAGAEVLATDWAPDALELVAANAAANGLSLATALLDWHAPGAAAPTCYDVVLAADVLYEERNALPLLAVLAAATAPQGIVLVADPGRRHAPAFFDRAAADGWTVAHHPADEVPSGSIATLRRAAAAPDAPTLC